MDLRAIEIFLAICDEGGLTAAAQSLGLTQAAVSQHLAKLERELGVLLMDRSVRPPRLSAAGQHLRKRGQALVDNLHAIHAELLRYRHCDIPELRLGIIESAASAILPSLVRRLTGKVGSLSVTSGTTHPLMPELLRDGFDMLITSEQIDDDERLVSQCLLIEPIVLILPKGQTVPRDWDGLAQLARDLDFIRYGEKRRLGRIVNHLLKRRGIDIDRGVAFDSSMPLFDYVRSGAGWAASTPMCMLSAGVDASQVEIGRFPDAEPIRSVNAIWRAERDGIEVRTVADVIRKVLVECVVHKLRERAGALAAKIEVVAADETAAPSSDLKALLQA